MSIFIKMHRIIYIMQQFSLFLIALAILLSYPTSATTTDILSTKEISEASPLDLESEATVFQSIGMGLALSLAHCEEKEECPVQVSETEMERLLLALNNRINGLVIRLESGDTSIEAALLMYADVRDNFIEYQKQMSDMNMVREEELDFSIFNDLGEPGLTEEELLLDEFDPSLLNN